MTASLSMAMSASLPCATAAEALATVSARTVSACLLCIHM